MDKFLNYFFLETKYEINDVLLNKIQKYEYINNFSYIIETKDYKKWLIKINYNHEKSINNEIEFLKKFWKKDFFYGQNYFIKEMQEGFHVDLKFILKNITQLKKTIENFHQRVNKIEVNYLYYLKQEKESFESMLYSTLLAKHKKSKIVLSHNDLNLKNLMYDGKKIFFIDFEWTKGNYEWFDIVNFIREENLSIKQIKLVMKFFPYLVNLQTVLEYLFINTYFAYLWTKELQNNSFQKKYLAIVKKQLKTLKIKMKRYM